jgi:FixJ family two-component response regulator
MKVSVAGLDYGKVWSGDFIRDGGMETIYIIDDDSSVRRSLGRLVRHAGYREETFSSGEEFLAACPDSFTRPTCIVVDLRMPGLSGLELQRRLNERHRNEGAAPCPLIFISGNGDIPASVEAMRQGAVTFLAKPFEERDLLGAIAEGLASHRDILAETARTEELRSRIATLSPREREVMAWVITGALNKQIAAELGIVEQTVKVHRARVMEKMGVVSVAELVRGCDVAGFPAAG